MDDWYEGRRMCPLGCRQPLTKIPQGTTGETHQTPGSHVPGLNTSYLASSQTVLYFQIIPTSRFVLRTALFPRSVMHVNDFRLRAIAWARMQL